MVAKVVGIGNEKAMTVVDRLCQGLPWRFDKRVPDHQVDVASSYLRDLGFAVDIQPVEGEIEPLSDPVSVATAEAAAEEEADVSVKEDSYRFKFQGDGRSLLNISFVNLIKTVFRSEERRVGKECRSRWSPYH